MSSIHLTLCILSICFPLHHLSSASPTEKLPNLQPLQQQPRETHHSSSNHKLEVPPFNLPEDLVLPDLEDYYFYPTSSELAEEDEEETSLPSDAMLTDFSIQDTGKEDPFVGGYPDKRAREFIGKRAREFIGKRAREFIGKRAREFIGKRAREFIGKRAREFIGKRAREFIGKRAREFIGKRAREFIGKRAREFIGKRNNQEMLAQIQDNMIHNSIPSFLDSVENEKRGREFIGKRYLGGDEKRAREFIGKRAREFIGKRSFPTDKRAREFIGKRAREFIGKRNSDLDKRAREFIGKRAREFIGKRSSSLDKRAREFIGKRAREFIGKRSMSMEKRPREFIGKRAREFIGKRSDPTFDKRGREFIGKRDGSDDNSLYPSYSQLAGYLETIPEISEFEPTGESSEEFRESPLPLSSEEDYSIHTDKRPREFIGKRTGSDKNLDQDMDRYNLIGEGLDIK